MPDRKTIGVWLLIACHVLIALPLAWHLNIWSDEASSLYSTESVISAFQNAALVERQAPLYFWILSLWRSIDGSIFFARLLSVLFIVAAIWMFHGVVRRVLQSARAAALATAFFALHPITIWASSEIRVYSLVSLLSVTLTRSFIDVFFEASPGRGGRPPRNAKLVFLITTVIALYTNYYLGFQLVGMFVALVIMGRWRQCIHYLAFMFAAAVAVSPLALVFGPQFSVNTTDIGEPPALIPGARHIWNHILTFILPADIRPGFEASTVGIVRLWIVRIVLALTAVIACLRWERVSKYTVALGAISATIFAGLLTAYFFVGGSLVELRHASVLFAPLTLFLASLIADAYGTREHSPEWKYAATLAGVVVLWFFWYAVSGMYPNWSKNGDWSRVAAYIQQKETPGQPIIVFHTYDALVMPYEYHGVNGILPDERFFDFDFGVSTAERIKERTDFTISKVPPDAKEIWVIANDECRQPGVCEQFEEFLNKNYQVVEQKAFYRNNVTLLRKWPSYQ
jgi:hypothetical protein